MASIVDLILSAKNNASPEIKKLAADVASLDKQIGALSSLTSAGLGLAGVAAAIASIQQLGQALEETSKAGASFSRLSENFNRLSAEYGNSGQAILSAIESVTQGTLSQQTIMQQANNAMLLGVADSADEFETLAKIAVDRGRAMGISMEYAFESIVKGVGRLSPLILDNLGIVLDADTTYKQYAETIGKTADSLTDMEKRAALISRLKEEVSDFDSTSILDAAGSWERLGASIESAKISIGEWLNESTPLLDALNQMSDSLDILADVFSNNLGTEIKAINVDIKTQQNIIEDAKNNIEELKNAASKGDFLAQILGTLDSNEANLERATKKLEELIAKKRELEMESANSTNWWRSVTTGATAQADSLRQLESEYSKVSDTIINWYAKALQISKDEAENSIHSVIAMKGSWEAAAPAIAEAGNQAIIAAQKIAHANSVLNSMISGVESAALQAYADSGFNPAIIDSYRTVNAELNAMLPQLEAMDEIGGTFLGKMLQEEAAAPFKAVSEYANEAQKSIGGAASATKTLTKEFQSLQGIVSGLVSDAMQDIGGADLSEFLPYQDAPAEDARRIASVMVEGWDSEWVDYFKTKFPDLFSQYMGMAGGDIQKASALLLKDFQDGMRPELLDKGKIKELAKKMFFADQETSQMVDEIAKDLAKELGISIEEAKAAVGGAAGVKKKPMTKEEIEKLFGGIDMAPKWDMSGSKEKFKAAGIAAGVLDNEGRLLVDVGINISATADDGIKKALTAQLTITGAMFTDKQQILDWLKAEMSLPLQLSPVPSDLWAWRMEEIIKPLVKDMPLKLYPTSVEDSTWITYYDTLRQRWGQFGLEIVPFSTQSDVNPFSGLKDKLNETFSDPMFAEDAVFNLGANIGLAIFNSTDGFSWQGKFIGTLIMQSFEEYNVGQLMANAISTQLTQAQKTFEVSAANSGKAWGNSFLQTVQNNVPLELIKILTDLVTPQVKTKLESDKGRGESE